MSENFRQGSPFLTSPRRVPSIARPEWPWSPSLSYDQRSSSHTSQSSNFQTSLHWDSNRSNNLPASQTASSTPSGRHNLMLRHNVGSALGHTHSDSTRQWSYLVRGLYNQLQFLTCQIRALNGLFMTFIS